MIEFNDIHQIARALGVGEHAIAKWRQRRVPDRWRIAIVQATAKTKAPVRFEDFDRIIPAKGTQ